MSISLLGQEQLSSCLRCFLRQGAEAKKQEFHRLANMLATVCVTLGEMPLIRFDKRSASETLASVLQVSEA